MNLLSLTGVDKAFGPRVILDGVTFGLDAGTKVGLIGDNGTGKSTLLKIITGQEPADAGRIALRAGTRVGFLEQVPDLSPGKTAREIMSEPFAETVEAIARYETAAAQMADDAERWLAEIERLGGWDWMNRLEQVATQLGVDPLDEAVDHLSGGQRKRIALARMILTKPDIALFDEPTNHLDTATVEWLESWIAASPAACMVVTHDRYFLSNVVSRMAELRDGRLAMYEGSYQSYLEARAEEEAHRARAGHRRYRMLKAELEWARRSPQARTTKSKARLGRVDALASEVKTLRAQNRVAQISLGDAPRLGKTVLELVDVHKRFDPEQSLVDGLSLILRRGDRVGVIGPNGSGKTTLMRMLLGEVTPDSGRIVCGANTQFAYFDQHRSVLKDDVSVRQTVCPSGDKVFVGGRPVHVASWLERFAFGSQAHNLPVGRLSGGERNRLALARFLLEDANFLLLDEPTNDLDLMTMHVLEEALVGFDGCLMVVSHDRYFLDRVATHIVAFEDTPDHGRELSVIAGDYTTYRRLRQSELDRRRQVVNQQLRAEKEAARAEARAAVAAAPDDGGVKPLSYKERRELQGIEPAIEGLEQQVADIDEILADPALWAEGQAGADRGRALQAEKSTLEAELEALYARWESLSAREHA